MTTDTAEYDLLTPGLPDRDEIDLRTGQTDPSPDGAIDVDAIVLDLDDTLYLERDYVRSGFHVIGRWAHHELGIDDFGERAWASFESGSRDTVFDQVLESCGRQADDALVTELVARYRTHAPSIALTPDAEAALQRWHQRVALAAITDGPASSQQAKARALDLERWVSPMIVTASLGPGMAKPHPAAFELAQETLGVQGARCVYVADDPTKDFAAPKALGWRTVRVRRPLGLHVDVPSGQDVDYEVTSLDHVDHVLIR